jgi:DNA-binding CsgD family transcriptional regulator
MTMQDSGSVHLPAPARAVLALSATGQSTAEIAVGLQLSPYEVHVHLSSAMGALGARSKLEAILAALRLRLILVPSSLQCDMLKALAGGATLVGTSRSLARSLRASVKDLRAGLRGLLEVELIAVNSDSSGRLVVRLERRVSPAFPPIPQALERRRTHPDIGLL